MSAISTGRWRNSYKGQFKESYYDYKHTLELAPDFKPAQDQLQNFIVTKAPAKGG